MDVKSAGSSGFGLIGSMVEAGRDRVEVVSIFGGGGLHQRWRPAQGPSTSTSPGDTLEGDLHPCLRVRSIK
jgi:hypothetical protein